MRSIPMLQRTALAPPPPNTVSADPYFQTDSEWAWYPRGPEK